MCVFLSGDVLNVKFYEFYFLAVISTLDASRSCYSVVNVTLVYFIRRCYCCCCCLCFYSYVY